MPEPARRKDANLVVAQPDTHAGLWLDKYLPIQLKKNESLKKDEKNPITEHFGKTAEIKVSPSYQNFFTRWEQTLKDAGATCHTATVNGRMVVGMGAESVLENSVNLHRTYGVPYIPGSALKGLAAHYANNRLGAEWKKGEVTHQIVFGDIEVAGYVTFYDALLDLKQSSPTPLALDVMTVHHPDYYGGKESPPADWDSPTPISFLSATGSYLIALGGPKEWVDAAFEILACALRDEGIGAKTSSGYGRMVVDGVDSQEIQIITTEPAKESYALGRKRLLAEKAPAGRLRGTVINLQGSFASINPALGGKPMFVHVSQVRSGQTLKENQVVEYQVGLHNGKQQAQDVEILLEPDK